jgi:hypothetical protein
LSFGSSFRTLSMSPSLHAYTRRLPILAIFGAGTFLAATYRARVGRLNPNFLAASRVEKACIMRKGSQIARTKSSPNLTAFPSLSPATRLHTVALDRGFATGIGLAITDIASLCQCFKARSSRLGTTSGLSSSYVSANHFQVPLCGFEGLLCIVVRNESSVVIKSQISLPSQTIKDHQQSGMLLVDASSNKIDNCDMVSWLASGTKTITKHESQRGHEHRFVGFIHRLLGDQTPSYLD